MGWSEKSGIGLSNKGTSAVFEPMLRPKGLGLGAGASSKKPQDASKNNADEENLSYKKGAYVKVLSGKNRDDYGKLVSFDDGLNRILVKMGSGEDEGKTVSLLQNLTQLVTRGEYKRAAAAE